LLLYRFRFGDQLLQTFALAAVLLDRLDDLPVLHDALLRFGHGLGIFRIFLLVADLGEASPP
jgi:hypothetical protein